MALTSPYGEVTAVTDESFKEAVLDHEKPVLVDFWAEWCPPCRMIAPVLKEIASEHAESLTIRKVNVDENPEVAQNYRVMSVPTLMLFRNGEPVQTLIGARPKTRLLSEIEAALGA